MTYLMIVGTRVDIKENNIIWKSDAVSHHKRVQA